MTVVQLMLHACMYVCKYARMYGRTDGRTDSMIDVTSSLWCVAVTTAVNIALGKPAFMSSLWGTEVASFGNDGNKSTYFSTNQGNNAWWAVDFGEARTSVTAVRITNRDDFNYSK